LKALDADGTDIFVQPATERGKRGLFRARYRGVSSDGHLLELEAAFDGALDQPVFLYYERAGIFVQHAARILESSVEPAEQAGPADTGGATASDTTLLLLETRAEPVPAEHRSYGRGATVVENLAARFGDEENCRVLELGQTGFSLYADTEYEPGAEVEVTLAFEGTHSSGDVLVQSVERYANSRRIRYGLRVIGGPLARDLPRVAVGVELERLRRRRDDEAGCSADARPEPVADCVTRRAR